MTSGRHIAGTWLLSPSLQRSLSRDLAAQECPASESMSVHRPGLALRVSRARTLATFELGRLALARMVSGLGRVPRLQHDSRYLTSAFCFLLSAFCFLLYISAVSRGASLTPAIDGWRGSSGGVVV